MVKHLETLGLMTPKPNPFSLRKIQNADDLALGVVGLCQLDPTMAPVIDELPEVPLRLRPAGFHGMAEIITAQQVSRASATAIFGRLEKLIVPLEAHSFIAAGEQPLIEAGLSRPKQATLTGLANAICKGEIDLESLCDQPVDDAMDRLTDLKGIGPWTAQVYLLFCAGHVDIFPAGDIALQHAAQDVLQLDNRPDAKTMAHLAERWSPFRGVAARVHYAHYALLKNQNVPVV